MLPIISQSRQAVLKGAVSQTRHTSVLASVIFYPAFLIHSLLSPCICFSFLFSYTASFNSNSPGLPSMMDNAEQLEKKSKRAFSNLSWCVCMCTYTNVQFWQRVNYFSANIWNCATCYWVSADGWQSLQSIFIKYYVFTHGALFCLCAFDVRAAPAGIKAH